MTLSDILQNKGAEVHTIQSSATLADVVEMLVENNCGSLVVVDQGRTMGIITERDILRAAANHSDLRLLAVRDHMTTQLLTARPNDAISQTMGLLTKNRIRHLPVLDRGQLVGIISIGDVVKAQHDQLTMENHYLKNYIHS